MANDNAPKPWEIVGHITEMKVMIAEQNVMIKEIKQDLREHSQRDTERRAQIEILKSEMDQAKGSLKTLKWLVPSGPVLVGLLFWALRASGQL